MYFEQLSHLKKAEIFTWLFKKDAKMPGRDNFNCNAIISRFFSKDFFVFIMIKYCVITSSLKR